MCAGGAYGVPVVLSWMRAWLAQKSAPLSVHYGDSLQLAGQQLPRPRRVRVPTRHGRVPADLYLPATADGGAPPVVLHLHGGAFMMRHPAMDDFFCRYLVARAGVAVLNLDYAVAPQARYPVAQEQTYDALLHLAGDGAELGVDGSRVAVSGFSAGGNLAASACLQARDAGVGEPLLQLLGVPSLDLVAGYDDKHALTGRPMISREVVGLVRATYFRDARRRGEAYASPVHAPDLTGLPPAVVVTGELDLLRAEGDAYAARLREAGVAVEHRVVRLRDHYFLDGTTAQGKEQAREELERWADAVRRHLGSTPAG